MSGALPPATMALLTADYARALDAEYGPHCKACGGERTKNPSRTCTRCLGADLCRRCWGKGLALHTTGALTSCTKCSGSGSLESAKGRRNR